MGHQHPWVFFLLVWCTFWKICQADAIIWENVQLPLDHILQRRFIGRAICVVGILFWSIPISSIQAYGLKSGWMGWVGIEKTDGMQNLQDIA